jgi:hypothetical protein
MSTMQWAVLAGCLVGLGMTLIIWRLVPAHPHLGAALHQLAPDRTPAAETAAADADLRISDRVGVRLQRHLPATSWVRVPTRELVMLRIPVYRYLGEKAVYAGLGLLAPVVLSVLLTVMGMTPPVVLPTAGGLLFAAGLSFLPDYNVRSDARAAREEFTRALGAFIDLVALERAGGAGSTQSLESAAEVGDSWVFQRLREELARARWSGLPPWDGLTRLADELTLPELAELGDIMRLSGEEGVTVANTLRARSQSLRTALLSAEHAKANAVGEKMTLPVSALSLIFLALLATPALLRILFSGT